MKNTFHLFLTFSILVLASSLMAQDKPSSPVKNKVAEPIKKKDIFTKTPQEKNGFEGTAPEIGILLECISLDHKTANQMIGKFAAQATDVEELRDELENMLDNGKADLVDTMWLVSRSGLRGRTESVKSVHYATQFDPPVIPNNIGNIVSPVTVEKENPSTSKIHMTSAMPIAFDYRNVGSTLEADSVLSSDHKLIDISLAPEIITRLDNNYFTRKGFEKTAHGVEHVFMPTFYTMKDTTQITVTPGKYNLLGIHTPPDDSGKRILVLIRADLISFE